MKFYQHNLLAILVLFSISYATLAQGSHDLIVVDARKTGKSLNIDQFSLRLLTDKEGYDNQPAFINKQQLAFSAADPAGNHDIILYSFDKERFTNLTKTKDRNEFSPSLTDCGLFVSAITVEPDGKQRLWLYPTNFGEPELLYDDVEPVGYYDWYDNKAAMFVLGQPNTLVYPYSKEELYTIAENVGRSIKKQPKSSIITYIDKNKPQDTATGTIYPIKGFDIESRTFQEFGYTLPGSEDFIWLDKKLLLMGKGNKLFVRRATDLEWKEIAEFNLPGYQNISRMAYSQPLKKLVFVMDRL